MLRQLLFLFIAAWSVGIAGLGRAGVAYKVTWRQRGRGGFSAPNVLRDTKTGRTLAIVACEIARGVVAFDIEGRRIWEHPMVPPVTAAPAVADLDGDGSEDLVVADSVGNLVALTGAGRLLWSARLPSRVLADSCPAVADLDGDGKPEVLVGDSSGVLSCLDAKGALRWQFAGAGSQMGPPLVADLYDAAGREIIVTSLDRHIYALTARGQWIWDLSFENDVFPNSTPVLADVDGDGAAELYVGGGLHHFYRIDLRSHRPVLIENVYLHVNNCIAAADIDGDGRDEVVFGNKGGGVWCYGAGGYEWQRQLSHSGLYAAPTLLNLDADPALEIILPSIAGDVQILDTDGSVLLAADAQYKATTAPLAGDFDGDGMLELIGSEPGGDGPLLWVELNVPYHRAPGLAVAFAGNRARTGRPPGAKSYRLLPTPAPAAAAAAVEADAERAADPVLLSGPNTWRFDVRNPARQRLVLLLDIRYPDGSVRRFARHVQEASSRESVSFRVGQPGTYDIVRKLVYAETLAAAAPVRERIEFEGLPGDRRYFKATVFAATARAIDAWRAGNPRRAAHFAAELVSLRGALHAIAEVDEPERTRLTAALRVRAERLRALAEAGSVLAPAGSFFVWDYCPWAYFDPRASLPEPGDRTERLAQNPAGRVQRPRNFEQPQGFVTCSKKLSAFLCRDEYESLALNLTNVSERTLEVRVFCDGIESDEGESLPVAGRVQLRRAVTVPTYRRGAVADPLPRLGPGRLITVPALESQQLWITVHARDLEPGSYVARLRLKSVEADPTELRVPIALTVYDIALPRPRPLRFCMWSYDNGDMGTANPRVLRELVEHGTTVFFAPAPRAECNAAGQLVGKLDFTAHDDALARLAPHGYILFLWPQNGLRGQPFLSDPWRRAFVKYLRAWVEHMKAIGMDDDWALYPYDEPSTPTGRTLRDLVQVARIVRQADPSIKIYTDPTSGTTMESVEKLKDLVDIWCPSTELLDRLGDEMLRVVRQVATEIWYYGAPGRAKTLSCLGHYRQWMWRAWVQNMTGAGWWCFAHHADADRWDGPNRTGNFYATAYDAPGGLVTSKRWEATREAIEDYEYLFLLRAAIAAAEERHVPAAALADARQLLATLPAQIESTLRTLGRRLPLTTDSVPRYEYVTQQLDDARRNLADTILHVRACQ